MHSWENTSVRKNRDSGMLPKSMIAGIAVDKAPKLIMPENNASALSYAQPLDIERCDCDNAKRKMK
jgi:hypothetical protein